MDALTSCRPVPFGYCIKDSNSLNMFTQVSSPQSCSSFCLRKDVFFTTQAVGVLFGSPSPLAPHASSHQVYLLNISILRIMPCNLASRVEPDLAPPSAFPGHTYFISKPSFVLSLTILPLLKSLVLAKLF